MDSVFIGTTILKLDRIDSTNTFLLSYLREKELPEGFIVTAEEQFAGRGQRAQEWVSQKGTNLTFSLLLKARFLQISEQFYISKIIALALCKTVQLYTAEKCTIKWPNDIYVGNKKIAGILIENVLSEHKIERSVVGIGLNVNQSTFPKVIKDKASSLFLLCGKEVSKDLVLKQVCKNIEVYYLQLRSAKKNHIDAAYHELLFRMDDWYDYENSEGLFSGKIVGVGTNGKLLLKRVSGAIESYDLKEISFVF